MSSRPYTYSKPILNKRTQEQLNKGADVLNMVPDPTVQKIALVAKGISKTGDIIKERKRTVPVKSHIRRSPKSGRPIKVRSHRRTVKSGYSI